MAARRNVRTIAALSPSSSLQRSSYRRCGAEASLTMTLGDRLDDRPQFGTPARDVESRARPAAFGMLEDAGKLALVRITPSDGGGSWLDLPGGALDPGEDSVEALVR